MIISTIIISHKVIIAKIVNFLIKKEKNDSITPKKYKNYLQQSNKKVKKTIK